MEVTAEIATKPIVLLVDDEENILKSLRRTLRRSEVDIVTATSGRDALYIMENTEVDLVISDMRMPEMSGAEFLAEAARLYPNTIRILLTGYADLESTIAAVNEGRISRYLNKPWNDDEIRQIVEENLRSKLLEVRNQQLSQQLLEKNQQLEMMNASLEEKVAERTEGLKQANREIIQGYEHMVMLASSIAAMRDESAADAASVKAAMAEEIARQLAMDEADIAAVRDAALLSDLGKMGFSDQMLRTPYSQYDKDQLQLFKQYPLMGEAALLGVPQLFMAGVYIRNQFERFDGSGFPDKLAGERIPLGSRILTVVRDFIDLRMGKYTGTEYEEKQAESEIVRFSESRYDPEVVSVFSSVYQQFATDGLRENEQLVKSNDLQAGMILSRHLLSSKGMVLLKKGFQLNQAVIDKVINLEHTSGENLDVYIDKGATQV
ncbi:HD domain-containing phosphohydrolase [Bacterioplanoides sp. SCSIO 12839]|uniref:HD domain-containing phosphohydrolase n=1 Tax=Bacterioplanoides sp. SCSIO 12839 TaxID=2829569 RepID=UPI002104F40F|nr:HD domain-containing phosphohydrolase [Bacterioplanoides sp. SCSIO 12839]UTW47186.1 response regulator [Bacterioplanoides sp. SCSIO 12839]